MIERQDLVEIGKFQRTHALKGELNALLDVDGEFAEEHPVVVEMDGIPVPFFAEGVRPKGSESWLVKLKGVDSQEDARQMVNKTIYALRDDLREFYDDPDLEAAADLTGYEVRDAKLGTVGRVTAIDDSTANVLLVVSTPDGRTVYVPVAGGFITAVDDDSKLIETDLPEGLVELNVKKEK